MAKSVPSLNCVTVLNSALSLLGASTVLAGTQRYRPPGVLEWRLTLKTPRNLELHCDVTEVITMTCAHELWPGTRPSADGRLIRTLMSRQACRSAHALVGAGPEGPLCLFILFQGRKIWSQPSRVSSTKVLVIIQSCLIPGGGLRRQNRSLSRAPIHRPFCLHSTPLNIHWECHESTKRTGGENVAEPEHRAVLWVRATWTQQQPSPGGIMGTALPACFFLMEGTGAGGATLSVWGGLKGCRASWGQRTQGWRQSGSLPALVMPLRHRCACVSGDLPDTLSLTQQVGVNLRFCLSHQTPGGAWEMGPAFGWKRNGKDSESRTGGHQSRS